MNNAAKYNWPVRSPIHLLKQRIKSYVENTLGRDIDLARRRRSVVESAEFVDQCMRAAKSHPNRLSLLQAALREVDSALGGLYCEFGVYRGESINYVAARVARTVHGFDSFEGLPEDWRPGFERGTFATGYLPDVRPNVLLHKGWFQDTLPAFLRDHPEPIEFLHIDADLYSSAKTVLDLLGDRIVAGTVIEFDEFFNYPGWKEGEYRAFSEFCVSRDVELRYIGYTRNDEQVALKILKINAPS